MVCLITWGVVAFVALLGLLLWAIPYARRARHVQQSIRAMIDNNEYVVITGASAGMPLPHRPFANTNSLNNIGNSSHEHVDKRYSAIFVRLMT
jgi:hypothetical protein